MGGNYKVISPHTLLNQYEISYGINESKGNTYDSYLNKSIVYTPYDKPTVTIGGKLTIECVETNILADGYL
ncbi:hypothetical protein Curi_c24840 [Gottschalkia acidurici 9a]|uniref:Uncharacterized protein n=1 Tax=Gottschalkia acidurici (strain ATCC 7906 / DSM 604 / BCRC 14475 / CIP 104303 / KCTC 5404 / NCIMB 10678 / 9a) TaxID=1128398 RepID=K0B1Y8_GOTA9|nr:hypothetical protein Curi_c24840 [Gottschalkia acidurici 9a]